MDYNLARIDADVPLPGGYYDRIGRKAKYPWKYLKVGDSFWVDACDADNVMVATTRASRRTGFRFATRAEGKGRRVWRVA